MPGVVVRTWRSRRPVALSRLTSTPSAPLWSPENVAVQAVAASPSIDDLASVKSSVGGEDAGDDEDGDATAPARRAGHAVGATFAALQAPVLVGGHRRGANGARTGRRLRGDGGRRGRLGAGRSGLGFSSQRLHAGLSVP